MGLKFLSLFLSVVLVSACGASSAQGAADYATAVKYMRGDGVARDSQKAMAYLGRAVNEGNPNAELATGYFYLKGTGGMTKDAAKAVEFFTRSANHGNRDAQYNVGLAYVRGEGVKADFAAAYGWFEKAAYQGDAGAQYNLGVMNINGEGTAANPLAAYVWFKLASEQQYNGASDGMATAKGTMSADQAKQADSEYAKISAKVTKPAGSLSTTVEPANQPL